MKNKKILIADDDSIILNFLLEFIGAEGFRVFIATNGKDAVELCDLYKPHLVLLDTMLPIMDGFDTCIKIREFSAVPIILTSETNDIGDRVRGLTCGSDDFIAKPFDNHELLLRIKAILRRTEGGQCEPAQHDIIETSGLTIDLTSRTVIRNGREIELTAKEFDLLWYLACNPKRVFTREQLFYQIWNSDFYGDRSVVTMLVKRLREKIEDDPRKPLYVKTVRGIGYKFCESF